MNTLHNYKIGLVAASFLLFASFDHNPLAPTTGWLVAITVALVWGLRKELKKN